MKRRNYKHPKEELTVPLTVLVIFALLYLWYSTKAG